MINKQRIAALVVLLLIPLVLALNGLMFNLIDPERAAGHPDYARNYHLLTELRITCFLASLAIVAVLWFVVCLLVIRSKGRSPFWLLLAMLGPFGFAVLATLNSRTPADIDRYARFVGKMNGLVRAAYELCAFVLIWMLAYQAMLLKRVLMIMYQAAATGVSTAQIIDVQNASSGMWAFSEGNEVMYFVILLYLLRPMIFSGIHGVVTKVGSSTPH